MSGFAVGVKLHSLAWLPASVTTKATSYADGSSKAAFKCINLAVSPATPTYKTVNDDCGTIIHHQ